MFSEGAVSVYVVVSAGKVAMLLNPPTELVLRWSSKLSSFVELFVHVRSIVEYSWAMAVRSLGAFGAWGEKSKARA